MSTVPTFVPVLSRGKHRGPRRGACFMEMVSFLAGESWSDHPPCTHPLLSSMARMVNDLSSDEARQQLVELTPRVIGLRSDDPRWDVTIARRAATSAIPVVAESRQRSLAVGILTCDRVEAVLEGHQPGWASEATHDALACAPHASSWARGFSSGFDLSVRRFHRTAAPVIVRTAVVGIAEAGISDPDTALYDLLVATIDDCERLSGAPDGARSSPRVPAVH